MSLLPVTLPRRLAACTYDALLALGIAMLTALVVSLAGTAIYGTAPPTGNETNQSISAETAEKQQPDELQPAGQQPVADGDIQTWSINPEDPIYAVFQRVIVGCSLGMVAAFYLFFWWRRGQTLGMVSWRIRVANQTGGPITIAQAITRFLAVFVSIAPFGLGFWWALLEPD